MKLWDNQGIQPGDIVIFGTHFCTGRPGEWIVLQINDEEESALIAATESVGRIPYNKDNTKPITWENCYLRSWLNKSYFTYFRASEKASVCEASIPASDKSDKNVQDYVFILSEGETKALYKTKEERILLSSNELNTIHIRLDGWREVSNSWLRADSTANEIGVEEIPICDCSGDFGTSNKVDSKNTGVRPCMWVVQSALKKKEEPAINNLNIRLLEKDRDYLVLFDDEGQEYSEPICAEFLDYDTKKRYVALADINSPRVLQVELNGFIDHQVEEKAQVLENLLRRRPYREIVEMTQRKIDEKEILSLIVQPAWMPTAGLHYPQIDESGRYMIKVGNCNGKALYWRVIFRNGNKALALCEQGIYSDTFMDDEDDDIGWENSRIRFRLNDEFYNEVFSDDEKNQIMKVRTLDESITGIPVYDNVFLLSAAEVNCLMPTKKERIISGTPDDVSLTHKLGILENKGDWWWLRSKGRGREHICCVSPEGEIDRQGGWGHSDVCAIRPAILVELIEYKFEVKRREI